MASIKRRPNGKWRARYKGPDGVEHARHFDRKVDGERWLAEQVTDIERNRWVDPRASRMRFGDYLEQWQARQAHHRPGTARATVARLRNHIEPYFGDAPIRSITRADVQAWVAHRSQTLSASYVESCYRLLAQVFLSAVEDRVVATSPCRKIQLPSKAKRLVVPIPVTAVFALEEHMPSRWAAAIPLAAGTGMRLGEVLGLTVDRVDWLRRSIRVDQQMQPDAQGRLVLSPTKTTASVRTIPVAQRTLDALAAHLAEWPAVDGRAFSTTTGRPMSRQTFGEAWRPAVAKAGLPEGARFHELRHFYASALIRQGLSVKVVQARLGHATAAETLDTYGHLWPDDEDRTRQAIEAVFTDPAVRAESADSRTDDPRGTDEKHGTG